jgi:hypothetical protein
MRDAKRPGGDQGGAVAGETGDTVDPRHLDGLGEGHRGQDGGEPARQPRLARVQRSEAQEVMVNIPVSAFS